MKAEAKADAAKAADTIGNAIGLYTGRNLEAKGRAPRYIEETRRLFRLHVIPR